MVKPKCIGGKIQNALVPAVTYCMLTFETVFDYDLGSYQKGFWTQSGNITLPFMAQSFTGQYVSPVLNSAIQSRVQKR